MRGGADRGEVRIDGARYEDWDAGRLGALIGYMPQDSVLFPGTVKENISRFAQAEGGDPARSTPGRWPPPGRRACTR